MISMKVNQADLNRVLAAIDRVGLVVASLAKSIAEESAKEFADLLRSNITSNKYKYAPHKAWKKVAYEGQQGGAGHFWLWMGTLLKSIAPWKVRESAQLIEWFVGLKYSGGAGSEGGAVSKKIIVGKTTSKKVTVTRTITPKAPKVTHIPIKGYVLQTKNRTGAQLGGSAVPNFGTSGRRIIKRQMN